MPIYLPPPPPGTIRPVILGPNISGYLNPTWENGSADYTSGAFSRLTWNGNNEAAYGPGAGGRYFSFDASSSNGIYTGETIQPLACYSLMIIKV